MWLFIDGMNFGELVEGLMVGYEGRCGYRFCVFYPELVAVNNRVTFTLTPDFHISFKGPA